MENIRRAKRCDLTRIAEMIIFNYRLNFYPIFKNDEFYFNELQVPNLVKQYENCVDSMWVYDDGCVKGVVQIENSEIKKLFVEPVLQGNFIGSSLLKYAIDKHHANTLWVLEKNTRAIRFYARHGFHTTSDKKLEKDTTEYLVRLELNARQRKTEFTQASTVWHKLYNKALEVQNDRVISPFIEAGGVAAAILTKKGNIYVGVCIDTASGLGMCAERNAIANMLTNGESQIDKVVAVMPDGRVGSPCGACREYMMQLDKDSAEIEILLDLETEKTVTLGDLMPDWWGKDRFENN